MKIEPVLAALGEYPESCAVPLDRSGLRRILGAEPAVDKRFISAALQDRAGFELLWAYATASAPEERAVRILRGADAGDGLSVPAPCFLAGDCVSTFSLAWQLLEDGLFPEWGSVLALSQSGGYGQFRRPWHSPPGNLYVSFRLPAEPTLSGDAAALALGLLVCKTLRDLGFPVFLKWPNDLLLCEKAKIGGILIEQRGEVLVAGMGINLTEAPAPKRLRAEAALPAAALFPYGANAAAAGGGAGLKVPFRLWRLLLSGIILDCAQMVKDRPLAAFIAARSGLAAWVGRIVRVDEGGGSEYSARIVGLGASGGLVLARPNGGVEEIFVGGVSLPDGGASDAGFPPTET
ncbi:MAG: biotin--[acetyl-CoA-carboxylase] ligase [Desulfovibrio sp.]|jgi:BirA family biotin operon repressor/biotin-[acetyl-CoA-carboxylase] ligase|nr:biotin--[acetyl-CoA-carboxylase] ligase [Desulfovibrio sp.]